MLRQIIIGNLNSFYKNGELIFETRHRVLNAWDSEDAFVILTELMCDQTLKNTYEGFAIGDNVLGVSAYTRSIKDGKETFELDVGAFEKLHFTGTYFVTDDKEFDHAEGVTAVAQLGYATVYNLKDSNE